MTPIAAADDALQRRGCQGFRLMVWCRDCGRQVEPDPAIKDQILDTANVMIAAGNLAGAELVRLDARWGRCLGYGAGESCPLCATAGSFTSSERLKASLQR